MRLFAWVIGITIAFTISALAWMGQESIMAMSSAKISVSVSTQSSNVIAASFDPTVDGSTGIAFHQSTNGKTWTATTVSYTDPSFNTRDPDIFADQNGNTAQYNGSYWMAYGHGGSSQASWSLASSTDLVHWTKSQDISCSAIGPACYAPKFYDDNSGVMHAILSINVGGAGNFLPYETHPTTANPGGAWSTPVAVGMTSPPASMVDVRIVRDGTSTRHMFIRNFSTNSCIEEWTSASDFSGYTAFTGQGVGFGLPSNTCVTASGQESPVLQKIGTLWYLYFWDFQPSPNQTAYTTTSSLTSASTSYAAAVVTGMGANADATGIVKSSVTLPGPVAPTPKTIAPTTATIADNAAAGTVITPISVTMSDGSTFSGTITKLPNITLVFSPASPENVACVASPGTVITQATASGGDGIGSFTYSMSGDTTDFAINSTTGALTVNTGGISSANCGQTFTNAVTASSADLFVVSGYNLDVGSSNLTSTNDGTHSVTVQACENNSCISQAVAVTINPVTTGIACDIGPPYNGAIPGPAQAAGMTHCAVNYDFTYVGNWTDQAGTHNWTNQSTWFTCQHNVSPEPLTLFYYPGAQPIYTPCDTTHINVATDPFSGSQALALSLTLSDINAGAYITEIDSYDNLSSCCTLTPLPEQHYIEQVLRPTDSQPGASGGFIWDLSTYGGPPAPGAVGPNVCFIAADNELFAGPLNGLNTSDGGAAVWNPKCDGNSGYLFSAGDFVLNATSSSYTTYGMLMTMDGVDNFALCKFSRYGNISGLATTDNPMCFQESVTGAGGNDAAMHSDRLSEYMRAGPQSSSGAAGWTDSLWTTYYLRQTIWVCPNPTGGTNWRTDNTTCYNNPVITSFSSSGPTITSVAATCNPCTTPVGAASGTAVGNVQATMSDNSTFNGTMQFATSGDPACTSNTGANNSGFSLGAVSGGQASLTTGSRNSGSVCVLATQGSSTKGGQILIGHGNEGYSQEPAGCNLGAHAPTRSRPIIANGLMLADDGCLLTGWGPQLYSGGAWVSGDGSGDTTTLRQAAIDYHFNINRLSFNSNRGSTTCGSSDASVENLVDAGVSAAQQQGYYLIVDNEGCGDTNNCIDWTNNVDAIWKILAARYANDPWVLFEIFNEPNLFCDQNWSDIGSQENTIYNDIRAAAPNNIVGMFTPNATNHVDSSGQCGDCGGPGFSTVVGYAPSVDYTKSAFFWHGYSGDDNDNFISNANANHTPTFMTEYGPCGSGNKGGCDTLDQDMFNHQVGFTILSDPSGFAIAWPADVEP